MTLASATPRSHAELLGWGGQKASPCSCSSTGGSYSDLPADYVQTHRPHTSTYCPRGWMHQQTWPQGTTLSGPSQSLSPGTWLSLLRRLLTDRKLRTPRNSHPQSSWDPCQGLCPLPIVQEVHVLTPKREKEEQSNAVSPFWNLGKEGWSSASSW